MPRPVRSGVVVVGVTIGRAAGEPTARPHAPHQLLEELENQRGSLIRLRQNRDARLLQDLGADEFAHAVRDIGVGDPAVRRGGVLGGNRD